VPPNRKKEILLAASCLWPRLSDGWYSS
jgi:hypothetical protein